MAGQPIPVGTANDMIKNYIAYMDKLGAAGQTQSVSFSKPTLMHWLAGVMPFADELRIFMGVYPEDSPTAGKISVILWPYQNGQPAENGGTPIEPFNDGSGQP